MKNYSRKQLIASLIAFFMVFTMLPPISYATEDMEATETIETTETVEETGAIEEANPVEEANVDEATPSNASYVVNSGTTGQVNWKLDSEGTLSIYGNGKMAASYEVWENDNGTMTDNRPWKNNRDDIWRIEIGEGVTSISDYAFAHLKNVQEIAISSTVKTIRIEEYDEDAEETFSYNNAFFGCNSLRTITVSDKNTKFFTDEAGVLYEKVSSTNWILLHCPAYANIKTYETAYKCREIADYAFANNQYIEELYIHDNCLSLEYGTFYGHNNIKILKLPAEAEWLGMILRHGYIGNMEKFIVSDSSSMYKTINGVLYSADGTELIKCPGAYRGVLQIPNGVKYLGQSSISDCPNITAVQLPDSLLEIHSWAFSESKNIKEITLGSKINDNLYPEAFTGSYIEKINVSSSNKYFTSVDGILFNKAKDKLVAFPPGRGGSYTVPKNVKTIGEMAFYNNRNLKKVDFEGVVTKYEYGAFEGCESLEEVVSSLGVGYSVEYGSYVFSGCKNLKKVAFVQNVSEMGEGTFEGCGDSLVVYAHRNSYPEAAAEAVGAKVVARGDSGAYIDYAYKEYKTPFYTLYSTGVLEITGSGYVSNDFIEDDENSYEHKNKIQHIIIGEKIDGIYAEALVDLPNLKSIRFESSDCSIKTNAFGWKWKWDEDTEEYVKEEYDNLIILGKSGSDAQYFCNKSAYDMQFKVFSKSTCPKHVTKKTYKKATTKANGAITYSCKYCGGVVDKETIYRISSVALSTTAYTYDGKVKKPTVKVKDAAGKLIDKDYYTVSYASGRKAVGKYKVTIKFDSARYSATVVKYFKINPQSTAITSLSSGKKALKVKWSKRSAQTSGYQVALSTSSKFSSASIKTVAGSTKTSLTVKSLKSKKTYYVKVRTYRTVNKVKYYSGWSKVKSVKVK